MFYLITFSGLLTTILAKHDDIESLSPFTAQAYNLLKSDELFDKLFEVSFGPGEAARIFMKSALDFHSYLGLPDAGVLPFEVSNTGGSVFEKATTPMDHYKIYANANEHYLKKKGILTPDNAEFMAKLYLDKVKKALDSFGLPVDAASKVNFITKVNADFLSSFGSVSDEDVRIMMKDFINELNQIQKKFI